nr:PREDICTED: cytochrome P450 4g15-like isoform X1 [Bemisia tabaci]UZM07729.1 CYP4G16A [Bemisia tabaci]
MEFQYMGKADMAKTSLSSSSLFSNPDALFYLLIPTIILWFVYFRMSRKRLYELAAQIQGPEGYPLAGSIHEFVGDPMKIFQKMWKLSHKYTKNGSPGKLWIGHRLIVFLSHPKDIEVIYGSQTHIYKSPEYGFFNSWLRSGILINNGEKWRALRKLIAPSFHLNVLRSFVDHFYKHSLSVVHKMKEEGSKEFDVHHYMGACTTEILLETAMGVDKKTHQVNGFEYASAVMKLCEILHLRQVKLWLRPDSAFKLTSYASEHNRLLKYIDELPQKVTKKKRADFLKKKQTTVEKCNTKSEEVKEAERGAQRLDAKRNKGEVTETVEGVSYGQSAGLKDDLDDDIGEKKRQPFLESLIENAANGANLTDEDIRDQINTIMFAGHDTTAAGSSFFLCMMGVRPDIQEKVVEELEQIFGDSDRPCTFEDTLEMKYMERCIMETLRLYPPVPMTGREPQEEIKLKSTDLTVPAKCTIVIGIFKLHRDPSIYPNPDEFNPDNFLPEKTTNRHYYAFVPFGAGPRGCLGRKFAMLQLKVLLSTVLRNYKIYSDVPQKDWKLQADIILKRADGFRIRLEPRKMTPKPKN